MCFSNLHSAVLASQILAEVLPSSSGSGRGAARSRLRDHPPCCLFRPRVGPPAPLRTPAHPSEPPISQSWATEAPLDRNAPRATILCNVKLVDRDNPYLQKGRPWSRRPLRDANGRGIERPCLVGPRRPR